MTSASQRILLLGCGRMGRAMLDGWLDQGILASDVFVVDPALDPKALPHGVRLVSGVEALCERPDVCVIAVKPQGLDAALSPCASLAAGGTLFLSIVAGKTLAVLAEKLGGGNPRIVRVMPNTPAAIGKGISALVANADVSPQGRVLAGSLLGAVGKTVWLEDESQMDAVTALSGSGPAYVFYLTELMAKAGEKLGLPADLAASLARETVIGSGALLGASGETPARLRQNVTSPGGTTAAALAVLMDEASGLGPIMDRALVAARDRSWDLAS